MLPRKRGQLTALLVTENYIKKTLTAAIFLGSAKSHEIRHRGHVKAELYNLKSVLEQIYSQQNTLTDVTNKIQQNTTITNNQINTLQEEVSYYRFYQLLRKYFGIYHSKSIQAKSGQPEPVLSNLQCMIIILFIIICFDKTCIFN